ncbi:MULTISPECIES: sigma-70 family RNA polymerase sigma factor [Rhodococcus]|jgi:RNA polymerase sigma-70 factor (ECF subfamily)|uniref:Sigma-70 family RNA polymerase sigma factor n=1 Tax=Rhodococcus cercidiphylli TaxID=489916 RepID=A0ABU4AT52_9NOCA|nr:MULTISPECIES: sigma-70 family RNA polymerase sigma factor [Rhodococcus]KAA0926565.1 sigma-70 family RNA polymerase sigma factor [Rhodococcus sp. ANT_H53B]MDI9924758.1 sigma-70 family RNA polymerase sigma factor [Rhodococcus sp. IEGM 1341]MDV6229419.1 sigma-70 family RNA polymerase sigma factor [Rhodococcus cercidiphylli]
MTTSVVIDELDHEPVCWDDLPMSAPLSDASGSSDTGRDRPTSDASENYAAEDAVCAVPSPQLKNLRADETDRLRRLMASVAQGDRAAFAELYDATSSRVYGMVLRVLRDPGYSEETAQEVFLQIWRAAPNYDPNQGSPLAWIMTLAHRRAVDRVRSEQSGTDREAAYGAVSHTPEHDEVLETVTQRLESEAVVACLDTLTDTQSESVRMAYYSGYTYREVAERLGVAVPTIKSRIRDGLIKLKTCLGVIPQ